MQKVAGSLGVKDADFGDQEAQVKAIVARINQQGGVAGRRLVPVFYDVKTNEFLQNPFGVTQAACAKWTQDQPVFVVVSVLTFIDKALADCLAKRQTPYVAVSPTLRPESVYTRNVPYLYAPTEPTIERLVPLLMKRTAARGYFGGWNSGSGQSGAAPVKVGILATRNFYGAEFTEAARKELSKQGHKVAATFEYSGDASRRSDEMNQAVLRFNRSGVTHIVVADRIIKDFAQAAENQLYRPRYALLSYHLPQILGRNVSKKQLAGALGIGHYPMLDVDQRRDPGDVSSAQGKCRQTMQKAGQDTSNRSAFLFMLQTCDGFELVAKAVRHGGLSPVGMQQGVREMKSMSPASTFGISFKGGRQDGASAVRDFGFRDSCECFTYLSKTDRGM